jgi:hypothetical protein
MRNSPGDVHDAHQAVLQVEAEGDHGINAARHQAGYDEVDEQVEVHSGIIAASSFRERGNPGGSLLTMGPRLHGDDEHAQFQTFGITGSAAVNDRRRPADPRCRLNRTLSGRAVAGRPSPPSADLQRGPGGRWPSGPALTTVTWASK